MTQEGSGGWGVCRVPKAGTAPPPGTLLVCPQALCNLGLACTASVRMPWPGPLYPDRPDRPLRPLLILLSFPP